MKRNYLLLLLFFTAVLPLTAACSDYDDQPGVGRNAPPTATATTPPTPTAVPTAAPTPEPGGWVWRLVETTLNPEQRPDEICAEPGRCTWFTISEGHCLIDKIETQTITDSKRYEYQIDCSCDKPPNEVWPGEEYRLQITCANELKYAAEGTLYHAGQVAVSWYGTVNPGQRRFLQAPSEWLWYSPWHPEHDGVNSMEWVLFGPWGELGDEFELIATCGDDACRTHWRYTLQIDE